MNRYRQGLRSGGFAAKELVFFLAAAIGATEAAEQQNPYSYGDKHREHGSKRK
jgi:hypothetical protein